jgi:Na+/melibiose symporter-like transporter
MLATLLTIYVVACLFTGLFGRHRRMGFIGTFLISLLITPVLMLLVLAITGPAPQIEWRRRPDQGP